MPNKYVSSIQRRGDVVLRRTIPRNVPVLKLLRAGAARLIFILHGLVTVWRAVVTYQDAIFWSFLIFLFAIAIEGCLVVHQRAGNETRWFCTCIFLFLCATVPPIWFLELYQSNHPSFSSAEDTDWLEVPSDNNTHITFAIPGAPLQVDVALPIRFEMWAQVLEQTLLVVLIIGRWLLPKGELTREQLSQILLGYLATAADCVDFFEMFKEKPVRESMKLTYIILIVWSVSLLQYPLVITGKSKRTHRIVQFRHNERPTVLNMSPGSSLGGYETEMTFGTMVLALVKSINVWGVMVSVCLQDFPFFIVRIYFLSALKIRSYSMLFFTCKNTLICSLQLYRLLSICYDENRDRKKRIEFLRAHSQDAAQTMEVIYKESVDLDGPAVVTDAESTNVETIEEVRMDEISQSSDTTTDMVNSVQATILSLSENNNGDLLEGKHQLITEKTSLSLSDKSANTSEASKNEEVLEHLKPIKPPTPDTLSLSKNDGPVSEQETRANVLELLEPRNLLPKSDSPVSDKNGKQSEKSTPGSEDQEPRTLLGTNLPKPESEKNGEVLEPEKSTAASENLGPTIQPENDKTSLSSEKPGFIPENKEPPEAKLNVSIGSEGVPLASPEVSDGSGLSPRDIASTSSQNDRDDGLSSNSFESDTQKESLTVTETL